TSSRPCHQPSERPTAANDHACATGGDLGVTYPGGRGLPTAGGRTVQYLTHGTCASTSCRTAMPCVPLGPGETFQVAAITRPFAGMKPESAWGSTSQATCGLAMTARTK